MTEMANMPSPKRKEGYGPMRFHKKDGVVFMTLPLLDEAKDFGHAFSTRIGGVSTGYLGTLNMGTREPSDAENAKENHRRFAAAVGYDPYFEAYGVQTHSTNIRQITREDAGKCRGGESSFQDVDGLITDVPGAALLVFTADCVPLIVMDPAHRAAACAHSGWRGTVADMGGTVLRAMHDAFGTMPGDVLAGIGPSICRDCYEVSEDVIEKVREAYPEKSWDRLFTEKGGGKYQLDLWEVCRENFLRAGVPADHIAVTDLCTACNPDLLFSHRATGGKRGLLASAVFIRE